MLLAFEIYFLCNKYIKRGQFKFKQPYTELNPTGL